MTFRPQWQNACRWDTLGVDAAQVLAVVAFLEHDRAAESKTIANGLSHRRDRAPGSHSGAPPAGTLSGCIPPMRSQSQLQDGHYEQSVLGTALVSHRPRRPIFFTTFNFVLGGTCNLLTCLLRKLNVTLSRILDLVLRTRSK